MSPAFGLRSRWQASTHDIAARRRALPGAHRSHTTIGYSVGTSMNMGVTLAVYATICRETGRPFVSPGSAQ